LKSLKPTYPLYPGQIKKVDLGMIVKQHPLPYISGIKKTCQGNYPILGPSDHALGLLVYEKYKVPEIRFFSKISQGQPVIWTILFIYYAQVLSVLPIFQQYSLSSPLLERPEPNIFDQYRQRPPDDHQKEKQFHPISVAPPGGHTLSQLSQGNTVAGLPTTRLWPLDPLVFPPPQYEQESETID
jgi:hypothetical protein